MLRSVLILSCFTTFLKAAELVEVETDLSWLLLRNGSSGLELQSGGNSNTTTTATWFLENLYFPTECGPKYELCNSLSYQGWTVLPTIGNLTFWNQSTQDIRMFSVDDRCNPTYLFLRSGVMWVACRTATSLSYLGFFLSVENGLPILKKALSSQERPGNFSRSVLISHPSCLPDGEATLYSVADDYIWRYPISAGSNMGWIRSDVPLENCTSIDYIDFSGGTTFTIHCSGGETSAVYDACTGILSYRYYGAEGVFFSYPPIWSVSYKRNGITVTSSNGTMWHQRHEVGDIDYGKSGSDFFIALTSNGSLYAFSYRTGSFYQVARNICDESLCFRPTFGPMSSRFVGFDESDSSLFVINNVAECAVPVKEVYREDFFSPHMILTSSSPKGRFHNFRCDGNSNPSTSAAAFTLMPPNSAATMTEGSMIQNAVRTIPVSIIIVVVVILVAVSCVAIIVVVVVFCVAFCRLWKKKRRDNVQRGSQHLNSYSDAESNESNLNSSTDTNEEKDMPPSRYSMREETSFSENLDRQLDKSLQPDIATDGDPQVLSPRVDEPHPEVVQSQAEDRPLQPRAGAEQAIQLYAAEQHHHHHTGPTQHHAADPQVLPPRIDEPHPEAVQSQPLQPRAGAEQEMQLHVAEEHHHHHHTGPTQPHAADPQVLPPRIDEPHPEVVQSQAEDRPPQPHAGAEQEIQLHVAEQHHHHPTGPTQHHAAENTATVHHSPQARLNTTGTHNEGQGQDNVCDLQRTLHAKHWAMYGKENEGSPVQPCEAVNGGAIRNPSQPLSSQL